MKGKGGKVSMAALNGSADDKKGNRELVDVYGGPIGEGDVWAKKGRAKGGERAAYYFSHQ